MTNIKFSRNIFAILAALFFLCFCNTIHAEQILEKGENERLGWVEPDNSGKFRTCYQELIDIAEGSIKQTSDKCTREQRLRENDRRRKFKLPLLIIDDETKTEQTIKNLAEDYLKAEIKQDPAVMNRVLADDFINFTDDGVMKNKVDVLTSLKTSSDKDDFELFEITNSQVRTYGKTAVITVFIKPRGSISPTQETNQNLLYNFVAVKKNGQWQIVSVQKRGLIKPKLEIDKSQ